MEITQHFGFSNRRVKGEKEDQGEFAESNEIHTLEEDERRGLWYVNRLACILKKHKGRHLCRLYKTDFPERPRRLLLLGASTGLAAPSSALSLSARLSLRFLRLLDIY